MAHGRRSKLCIFCGQVASAVLHGRDVDWQFIAEHNHPWQ
ncbi:hypothetical protein ACFX2G_023329 [Malus domestica]